MSIEKNDLLKQKELKINSFTVNVKNPDKKKMSQFDLRFLKELADHPPKSYCEQSDENKKLRNENKELIAKNDASVQKLEEKQKEIEELLAKVNASVQVSEENEKYKKEMEILKGMCSFSKFNESFVLLKHFLHIEIIFRLFLSLLSPIAVKLHNCIIPYIRDLPYKELIFL